MLQNISQVQGGSAVQGILIQSPSTARISYA